MNTTDPVPATEPVSDVPPPAKPRISEDWLAVFLGAICLAVGCWAIAIVRPASTANIVENYERLAEERDELLRQGTPASEVETIEMDQLRDRLMPMMLKPWVAKIGTWTDNPLEALRDKQKQWIWPSLLATGLGTLALFTLGVYLQRSSVIRFIPAYVVVFVLAITAFLLANQKAIHYYNLEYALWALVVGLLISNTVGLPGWLRPAARTELYIKTGLVLLGAEVLLNKLLALGYPGIFIAWVVTPIVLVSTYLFGQYVLRIPSKSLNLVVSADMSVCGVSAAIATAAACKAKKEELSLAIGLSLSFTVVMMIVMPKIISATGMSEVVGGAWLGGTIDSTAAVAAAGEMVGSTAKDVAATIKMIQNILIGVVAFAVATYWVTYVDKSEDRQRPSLWEIWHRFPKFTLGFIGASIVFSYLQSTGINGETYASGAVEGLTKGLRGWFFCLAFVSIGLETNFRQLMKPLSSGKPLILYVCGQALNLALTLFMAWLMFEVVFPDAATTLAK